MGESYREAARRVLSSLADIFDLLAHIDGRQRMAVIFCHAGVLRILSSLTGKAKTGHALFHFEMLNAENVTLESRELRLPQLWLSESSYGVEQPAVRHKKSSR
jgi:broad specificity phosphatase PhoE